MKCCPQCNLNYDDKINFCSKDGTRLVAANAEPVHTAPIQAQAPPNFPQGAPQPQVQLPQPSTLLYLFADRVVQKDSILTGGTPVPCKEIKVATNSLAVTQFAFAFWSLRDQGVIGLAIGPKKGLIFKKTPVLVRQLRPAGSGGLEGEILRMLSSMPPDASVRDIIYQWFGSDSSWPHKIVISWAAGEAIALGLGTKGEGGIKSAIKGMFSGKIDFVPNCSQIAPLEPHANQLFARWQQFQANEAALYQTLIAECKSAIDSRVERQNTSAGFD
jgi:hypothetical protein